MPVVQGILETFQRRKETGGLIANLPYPYWNFYEWSQGSDHGDEIARAPEQPFAKRFDLILNCAYVMAIESADALAGQKTDTSALKKAIHDAFYVPETGLYCASTATPGLFTELGNSLAILSGVASPPITKEIAENLMNGEEMVKATLSMLCYKYDALLKMPGNESFVLEDIRKKYGAMLEKGATSFWETELGEADMVGAGSLCHGWSAMPVYYYHQILKED